MGINELCYQCLTTVLVEFQRKNCPLGLMSKYLGPPTSWIDQSSRLTLSKSLKLTHSPLQPHLSAQTLLPEVHPFLASVLLITIRTFLLQFFLFDVTISWLYQSILKVEITNFLYQIISKYQSSDSSLSISHLLPPTTLVSTSILICYLHGLVATSPDIVCNFDTKSIHSRSYHEKASLGQLQPYL